MRDNQSPTTGRGQGTSLVTVVDGAKERYSVRAAGRVKNNGLTPMPQQKISNTKFKQVVRTQIVFAVLQGLTVSSRAAK